MFRENFEHISYNPISYLIDNNTRVTLILKGFKNRKMNTNTSWKFHASNKQKINYDLIFEDMSMQHPIAILKSEKKSKGGFNAVLIHYSILEKADICGITNPFEEQDYGSEGYIYEVDNAAKISEFVQFVKKVKNTPWPENQKIKSGEVTVTLPSI